MQYFDDPVIWKKCIRWIYCWFEKRPSPSLCSRP